MRWVVGVVLLLLLLSSVSAVADEDAARYFTRRARDCLASGDLGEAEKQFQKALSELPGYLPAILGLAETALEKKDEAGAIGILETLLDEAEKNPPDAEGKAVVEQAEDLMKKLDRPRLEYRKLLAEYLDKLLALARKSEKQSPDLAGRCADRILRLRPGHAEAKAILDRVGRPVSSSTAGATPAAAAANETLLFNGKDFAGWEGISNKWAVESGVMVATLLDNAYIVNHKDQQKGDYTLTVEMRVREAAKSPRLAVVFGFLGTDESFELNVFVQSFDLTRKKGVGNKEKLARADPFEIVSNYDQKKWNTFVIKVEGAGVFITLNGKKLFECEAEVGAFDGYPGLIVQQSVAEIRKFSVIR
jgi:tetratricopeptide (TPR) repeat protein